MSGDDERVPLDACTLPDAVKVSLRALDFAKQFEASLPDGYIVAFDWSNGGRVKAGKHAPWVEMGPGLGLGAFRTEEIPKQAIYHGASFPYAVLVAKADLDNRQLKTIDVDESDHLILR